MNTRRRKPRTRLPIADPLRLGKTLSGIVREYYESNIRRAAEAFGLSRPTLSRLVSGKASSISFNDLAMLRRAVPTPAFREIDAAIVSPEANELLRAYDDWCTAEMHRLMWRDRVPQTMAGRAIGTLPAWEHQRQAEAEHLLQELRQEWPELFRSFDNFLAKRKHFAVRAELAYARIMAPLLDAVDSGGIERRWQDIPKSDLRRFVDAGMLRERVLLDRLPDVQQAHDVAQRDPLDLVWLYDVTVDDRWFLGPDAPELLTRYYAKRVRASRRG